MREIGLMTGVEKSGRYSSLCRRLVRERDSAAENNLNALCDRLSVAATSGCPRHQDLFE